MKTTIKRFLKHIRVYTEFRLRKLFGRLSPVRHIKAVLLMVLIMAGFSAFTLIGALRNICGRRDGYCPFLEITHTGRLDIVQQPAVSDTLFYRQTENHDEHEED
jgi:hypothetical protein